MPPIVRVLLATQAALDKLAARRISDDEAEQLLHNRHVLIENLRGARDRPQPRERRLLIGQTDGGRTLTLVIEETVEPQTWLLITGWEATAAERRLVDLRR